MKKKWWFNGSYTVEAAFVVPLGFLVLMSLSCLFTALLRQNNIHMSLLQVSAMYGYSGQKQISLEDILKDHVLIQWEEDGQEKVCYADYNIAIPFIGSRFMKMHQYQQMCVSDYAGISMVPEETGEGEVYIAENGKVFHKNRECTYLRTRIQSALLLEVKEKRNQSGGIYYPCESCCHSQARKESELVYYTSYGNRYHIKKSCSKIKRTVRKVKRSMAGNLSPCSKCGGE